MIWYCGCSSFHEAFFLSRLARPHQISLGGYVPWAPGDGDDFLVCFRSYFVMGFECTKIEHNFIDKDDGIYTLAWWTKYWMNMN
jgi:hypothetical protein